MKREAAMTAWRIGVRAGLVVGMLYGAVLAYVLQARIAGRVT
jgi:hypothetical protein